MLSVIPYDDVTTLYGSPTTPPSGLGRELAPGGLVHYTEVKSIYTPLPGH